MSNQEVIRPLPSLNVGCYGPHPTANARRPSKRCHWTHLWPHGDEGLDVEQRTWSKLGSKIGEPHSSKFKL